MIAMQFDADACACGRATPAVRELVERFRSIRWLEAPSQPADAARGHLEQHAVRARAQQPAAYGALAIETVRGGLADFVAFADEVRAHGRRWDWKFGVLKPLSRAHADAHGWSLRKHVDRFGAGEGSPILALGESLVWKPLAKARLDHVPADAARAAEWYVFYAYTDLYDAIEWQLAEDSGDTSTNPWWPLIECYATGWLPFAIDTSTFRLFAIA